jgi:hypothetical protein
MPELAIQIAAGSGLRSLAEFARRPYESMVGRSHEEVLPYTHVEQHFVGDRYGEHLTDVPRGVDYATQVQQGRERSYYWWIAEETPSRGVDARRAPGQPAFELPSDGDCFGSGWSYPEAGFRWMVDFDSHLWLPPLERRDYELRFDALPHVDHVVPAQRLLLLFNDALVFEAKLQRATRVHCRIPAAVVRAEAPNRLRLIHPDSHAPASASPRSTDERNLSVALSRLALHASVR